MSGKIQYDLTGKQFGRWLVKEYVGKEKWLCICECGNQKIVKGRNLRSGESKSCGCLHKEIISRNSTKHGLTNTRIYKAWLNMKSRCYNPNVPKFKNHGGKGITVCNEWLNFENFCKWSMENGYDAKLTIDRINNELGYGPDNCRWSTYKEQNNNTKQNHIISFNGKSQTIAQWADELGFVYNTLAERIRRGWSIEEAFNHPVQHHCEKEKKCCG